MRKTVIFLIILLCTGCGTNTNSNRISADGSTSMEKVIGFLSEAYMEENKSAKVTYNPIGSGAGIQAAINGRCDVGLSSRSLSAEEAVMVNTTVIAMDGIAVIVNLNNPIKNLTTEQIRLIYTGKILNWSGVGGTNSEIVLIGRETASGTRDGFETITDTKNQCQYAQELTSSGDVIQTVATNPNAIGYASIASVKDTVKTIAVNGIIPSKETIQNGYYQIQRDFLLVTSKNREMTDATKRFFEFVTSGRADQYVEMAGAIPILRRGADKLE